MDKPVWRTIRLILACLVVLPAAAGANSPLMVEQARKHVLIVGYTRGETMVTLSPEVSGRVVAVNHEVGDIVGDGPVVEIDTTFIDYKIQSTLASMDRVNAALAQADTAVAYLKKEFERMDALYQGQRATEVGRDASEFEWKRAVHEKQSLIAEKASLEVALAELRERRKRHDITAPEGWVVVGRHVEEGETASPGVPVAVVGNYGSLVAPLSLSDREYSALRDQPDAFDVFVDGLPARARIHHVNPAFDERTRKLAVELILVGWEGERRGGLKLELPLNIRAEGVMVPESAIINRYDNPRVKVAATGEVVPVLVLGTYDARVIVAENAKLPPGTELAPAGDI